MDLLKLKKIANMKEDHLSDLFYLFETVINHIENIIYIIYIY